MFGFLSGIISGKSSKQINVATHNNVNRPVKEDGLTGVARYLNTQTGAPNGASSVEKYLKAREAKQVSGVAKYVARQAVAARRAEKVVTPELTGVAAYLKNNIDTKPAKSGVAKYLSNRKETKVSGVSKYLVKQSLASKSKPVSEKETATGVEQYLKNKPVVVASGVAKYLASQALIAKQQQAELIATKKEAETIEPAVALTGVEKYLSQQAR